MHFDVRPMTATDGPNVLAVLNEAFGRQATWDWFEWKHLHGPWGPSTGWVAVTAEARIAAARLFLPWALWGSDGSTLHPIARAVDGAVAPWARRRGLFSRCVSAEMDAMTAGQRSARVLYSTSVPASREAYRKLEWTIWEEQHLVTGVVPSVWPAKLVWDDLLDNDLPATGVPGATAWNVNALRWRTSEVSGRGYRTARLLAARDTNGLVLRKTRLNGVATLVVVHLWGTTAETRTLVNSAALRLGCLAVLRVGGPQRRGLSIFGGASTISAWAPPGSPWAGQGLKRRLTFDFADLEGAM